jgi:uncharacterized protein
VKGESKKTWAYFDTSVLVKRYVREAGSEEVQKLLRAYRLVSSTVTPVEASTAFRRRKDSGDIAVRHFDAIIKRFDSDRQTWELIETGKEVLDRAERFGRENKVRALDAIHIASAILFREAIAQTLPFVTADSAQREAAAHTSLDVIWVE